MFLSFIVPVYNVEKYLPECLDSLLNQDIPHEDYEIVCINDGSTDGSLEILREYEKLHPNVHVIDQANGGVCMARNAGLDAAKGEYIWFVDADDWVSPNCLHEIRKQLDKPYDRIIVNSITLHEGDKAWQQLNSHHENSVMCRSMFRREQLIAHNCRFHHPEITNCEDGLFIYEFNRTNPSAKYVEITAYWYRMREGSATTSQTKQSRERRFRSNVAGAQTMHNYYVQSNVLRQETSNWLMQFIWAAMAHIATLPYQEKRRAIAEMKHHGLFPYKRPRECSLKKSYQTTRTDMIGKVFDTLYLNSHTFFVSCFFAYGNTWKGSNIS